MYTQIRCDLEEGDVKNRMDAIKVGYVYESMDRLKKLVTEYAVDNRSENIATRKTFCPDTILITIHKITTLKHH